MSIEDDFISLEDTAETQDIPKNNPVNKIKKIIICPKRDKRILLACVHGTASNPDSFGRNLNKELSPEIINFGRFLAQYYNSGVEIIPFKWSGKLSHAERVTAGIALNKYLDHTMKINENKNYVHVWTIAHSHGCNVVSTMAQRLKFSYPWLPIASVHMASPIAPGETDKVACVDTCYHFYGAHDATQGAGSTLELIANQKTGQEWWERKIYAPNTTNICMLKDQKNTSHKKIKLCVVKHLPKMLYSIDRWYKPYIDLVASTVHVDHTEENDNKKNTISLPLLCIKHLEAEKSDSKKAKQVAVTRKKKYAELEVQALERHKSHSSLFQSVLNKNPNATTPWHERVRSNASHIVFDFLDAAKIYKES
jgi:hypothetical protein